MTWFRRPPCELVAADSSVEFLIADLPPSNVGIHVSEASRFASSAVNEASRFASLVVEASPLASLVVEASSRYRTLKRQSGTLRLLSSSGRPRFVSKSTSCLLKNRTSPDRRPRSVSGPIRTRCKRLTLYPSAANTRRTCRLMPLRENDPNLARIHFGDRLKSCSTLGKINSLFRFRRVFALQIPDQA